MERHQRLHQRYQKGAVMKAFAQHRGVALPLMTENINTDVIIPSREMKRVSKAGLASGLFANIRYEDGKRQPDSAFLLNQPAYSNASILLLGSNAGCGSSREHAVWALRDYGFRVIIAESFASIFFDNCVANSILPVILTRDILIHISDWVRSDPKVNLVDVNLAQSTVAIEGATFSFEIGALARRMLKDGLSPIDLTLEYRETIEAFAKEDAQKRPWLYDTKLH
tara:strand:- start:918 stop:1592 length:675 start_codon:yes stop_codon:yes gene_type:complete